MFTPPITTLDKVEWRAVEHCLQEKQFLWKEPIFARNSSDSKIFPLHLTQQSSPGWNNTILPPIITFKIKQYIDI